MMRVDLGGWALLLIAVGLAYFICLKASKEGTKLFKYGGYAIGIGILVISLILAIADVGSRIRRRTVLRQPRRITTKPTTPPRIPTEIPRLPGEAEE